MTGWRNWCWSWLHDTLFILLIASIYISSGAAGLEGFCFLLLLRLIEWWVCVFVGVYVLQLSFTALQGKMNLIGLEVFLHFLTHKKSWFNNIFLFAFIPKNIYYVINAVTHSRRRLGRSVWWRCLRAWHPFLMLLCDLCRKSVPCWSGGTVQTKTIFIKFTEFPALTALTRNTNYMFAFEISKARKFLLQFLF